MPTLDTFKYATKRKNLHLRVVKGHFVTGQHHTNYYIDVAAQKARLSEAKSMAKEICSYYAHSTVVDTILCLDGMEVVGTCLADRLTEGNYINMNAHQTIYVVTPETTSNSQLIFRDNLVPMIAGKHVLVLALSIVSGSTVKGALEAIRYYGGMVAGVASVFATAEKIEDYPVVSVFNPTDLPDYVNGPSHECPLCKAGVKIDALVNCNGFSKL